MQREQCERDNVEAEEKSNAARNLREFPLALVGGVGVMGREKGEVRDVATQPRRGIGAGQY